MSLGGYYGRSPDPPPEPKWGEREHVAQERGTKMSKASEGVDLFTNIEVITVVATIATFVVVRGLLGRAGLSDTPALVGAAIAAVLVLRYGLWLEHKVSVNVGTGREPFGPLPPD
jgi:hypothetical protein